MQLSLPLPLLFASSLLLSSSSCLVRFGATAQVNSGNETELIGDDTDDESVLFDIPTTAINAGIFDTLVAALSATDLVGAISSPNGPFTVFAPTDAAFAALPDGLVTCLLEEGNLPVLSNILLYHVASGKALSTDLSNEMSVPTLLEGQNVIIDLSNGDGVKINDSTVSTPDVLASNGVIHIIDQVLVPPSVDVAAFLSTCGDGGSSTDDESVLADIPTTAINAGTFDTLVAALSATDLVGAISSPNGPFTVFAPTDAAFAALPDGLVTCLLEEGNLPVLSNILLYHVASGKALSTDLSNEMSVPTLLEGQNVIIDLSNGDGVKINDSTVSTPDVLASNGVIHIIDQVLVPSNVDVAAFLDTCNNGGSSDNKNDSSSLVDRFPNDIVQIGSDYSINVDRVDIDDDKGVENDADADADACKSIHDVLTDVGANEFSNLLKKRKIDFKYGEFTVFAPSDNLLLDAENVTNLDDILYFHIAANVIEETLTDYCGTSLVMLNDMILDSKQENSTTVCANDEVYQLGPGNRAVGIRPTVDDKANNACNGVVHTIRNSLMLPTPMETSVTAPAPSTDQVVKPPTQFPPDATPTQMMIPTTSPTTSFIMTPTQMIVPTTNDNNQVGTPTNAPTRRNQRTSAPNGQNGQTDGVDETDEALLTDTSAAPAGQPNQSPVGPNPAAPAGQPNQSPVGPNLPTAPTAASVTTDDRPSLTVPPFTIDGGETTGISDSGPNYCLCLNQFFVIAVSTFLLLSFF